MSRRRIAITLVALVLFGLFAKNLFTKSTSNKISQIGAALDGGGASAPGSAPTLNRQPANPLAGSSGVSTDSFALGQPLLDADQAEKPATAPDGAIQSERLVIKTATVEAQVAYAQLGEASRRVEQLVSRLNGYIVSNDDSTSAEESKAYATIAFRVPAASFDAALRGLEGEGVTILRRDISGQDVTAEYVDNESQIRNLEATAARLRSFLEKAETVTEAIEVNRTLGEYEGQIEILKGRQQYLSDSADMSLITLTLRSKAVTFPAPVFPVEFDKRWTPATAAAAAWADLLDLGKDVADLLIALGIWTPVWLPLLLLGRYLWRRFARPRLYPAPAAPISSAAVGE
ncbi:MAG TPA: DUF4349 domain-containing protein [Herpetosiphonaceae bacterium]|nr:DUF4349 domain-containing protein [Herpetosiphonaceae bacterium]